MTDVDPTTTPDPMLQITTGFDTPLPSEGVVPTNVIAIVCLVFLGLLGLTAAIGGIVLVAMGKDAATALAIFALAGTVAGVFGGFITGRASLKAAA